ncbi:MAG: tRNA (cytidine(34)-2'-O)-methyltransferase [Deltaproteobacteria bacterium]|nr:tRNA (cytidine(34)-2'-O)-methyltransferase [Deltaproteobacteria bacterium]
MQVVLVEPEIPQNTGSIARLCAATSTPLHLVGRLGFSLEDRYLKRAGLDYWPFVDLHVHASWSDFLAAVPTPRRLAFSSHGETSYTRVAYEPDDALVFGGETAGLPADLRAELAPLYCIPMPGSGVRSLNVSNAVSIVVYEALRQLSRV